MSKTEEEWALEYLDKDIEFCKIKYSKYAELIADMVIDYNSKIKDQIIFCENIHAHGRVIEQFATALTWKLIHPDAQPPSCYENRKEI